MSYNAAVQSAVSLLLSEVHAFHGQSIYIGLEDGIRKKKRAFRFIFPIVEFLSRSRVGNAVMLLGAILFFGGLRVPQRDTILFQYGLSQNNLKAFERLNTCLPQELRNKISINATSPAFYDRLTVIFHVGAIWSCSDVLSKRRHLRALPHLQGVIAVATTLFFLKHRFSDQLRVLCVASDHSPVSQAMLFVARRQGIKTCYVQHAPVTRYFPPLSFDVSFLTDRASLMSYDRAAQNERRQRPKNVIMLPPFVNPYRRPALNNYPYTIGICLSFVPKLETLERIIDEVCRHASVSDVLLRRHPRCAQDLTKLLTSPKVRVLPRGESARDFFSVIDVALVPSSGVAIEALHSGIPTFYTPNADEVVYDYYGFVKSGIVPEFRFEDIENPYKLTEFFNDNWEERFSDYDETVRKNLDSVRVEVAKEIVNLLGTESEV